MSRRKTSSLTEDLQAYITMAAAYISDLQDFIKFKITPANYRHFWKMTRSQCIQVQVQSNCEEWLLVVASWWTAKEFDTFCTWEIIYSKCGGTDCSVNCVKHSANRFYHKMGAFKELSLTSIPLSRIIFVTIMQIYSGYDLHEPLLMWPAVVNKMFLCASSIAQNIGQVFQKYISLLHIGNCHSKILNTVRPK